jgi:hypothetical protein
MCRFYIMLLTVVVGLSPMVSMSAESQLKVDVELRDSITSVVSYRWIDTQTAEAEAKFQSVTLALHPTPMVKKALDGDEALMARLFQPKWRELEGVATLSSKGRDILIAKWKRDPAFPTVKSVAVWDDPDFDLFLFEVDPSVVKSAEDIRTFWKSLFLVPNHILRLVKVEFKLARKSEIGTTGVGWVEHLGVLPAFRDPYSDPRGEGLYVGAYRTHNRAYMCLWAGKQLFHFDRDTAFIPERFPPLKQRLKNAATSSLLNQLTGPRPRVFVVADELVSRKLTPAEFNKMLDVPANELPHRLSLILGAINETKMVAQYKDEILRLVVKYSQQSEYNPTVLGTILRGLTGRKEIDLSQTALDLIAKGMEIGLSLGYLMSRGDTKETAEKLQALKVPENLENLKRVAVGEILLRVKSKKGQEK